MATYAIGDIQGCYEPLERLLRRIRLTRSDRVWLVGDLVNRGPDSLGVLRWARRLGPRCVAVLGNHDLHLLARAEGLAGPKRRDTLEDVLAAPDRDRLLAWLRQQPLLHRERNTVLVHAGLHPSWSVAEATRIARACERELSGPGRRELLDALVNDHRPPQPGDAPPTKRALHLATLARHIGVLTRLRTLTRAGVACGTFSGPPEEAPAGCVPWFAAPNRKSARATIVFGHWAALGLWIEPRVLGLDSGAVWGGALTALRLEDRAVFQVPTSRLEELFR